MFECQILPTASVIRPFIYLAFILSVGISNKDFCPKSNFSSICSCYNLEDGPFLECSEATTQSLRSVLSEISSPIKSLNVVDLDKSVKMVTSDFFPSASVVKQLQFLRTEIEDIKSDAFDALKLNLSSVRVSSSKLFKIPQKALAGLKVLKTLDLESNKISDIPSYSFYGLELLKLNMKENFLEKISEFAFSGLEKSLTELDLTGNRLKAFPMTSLKRLNRLALVRFASNEIKEVTSDGHSRLSSLQFMDLSRNHFQIIPSNCFRPTPSLNFLSLHHNVIETVHKDAFVAIIALESLDVSRNRIVTLDPSLFRFNKRLQTVDLSNNRINYINGLFERLPDLKEVFLMENNILEVPRDAFTDSSSLSMIYLERNAIRRLDPDAFLTLPNLSQVHLSSNFIKSVPIDLFSKNVKLTSLSLDDNAILKLESGVFKNLMSLQEIRLQNNRVEKIHSRLFDGTPLLIELYLQNNAIRLIESKIFQNMKHLQHVNLQGNNIKSLENVFQQRIPSFVAIQLDSNSIEELDDALLETQQNLRIFRLGHNRITQLTRATFKNLVRLKEIYLTNNSISIIEEKCFESLHLLQLLDLSLNRLKKITGTLFSGVKQLEELYLSNNEIEFIESLSLRSMEKLRVIDLSGNRIKKLDANIFQGKLAIRYIKLKNCQIEEIEWGTFKGLDNLLELDLGNNKIRGDSLTRLEISRIKNLKANGNRFNYFIENPMRKLEFLESLILDNSSIKTLPDNFFSSNRRLKTISLSNNFLEKLSHKVFNGSSKLEEVKLNGNFFTEIPYEALKDLKNLKILNMADNFIQSINFSLLNEMSKIQVLDFRNNNISIVMGFSPLNLTGVTDLRLTGNFIKVLPDNVLSPSLSLDVSGNKFTKIPPPSDFTSVSLKRLKMADNPLTDLKVDITQLKYYSLEEIQIVKTNISDVSPRDFDMYPSLTHLDLSENKISNLFPEAFKNLSKLKTLNLSLNELENLYWKRIQGLIKLELLNVSHNRLKILEELPADLKEIKILDFSFNQITRISKKLFVHLFNLAEIYLTGNWIISVAPDSFDFLKNLKVLDLSKNHLQKFPLSGFRRLGNRIQSLRVQENPISCNCEELELWEWLQDHQKLVGSTKDYLRCENPPQLREVLFMELVPPEFCSTPVIVKLAIQDIQPFSIVVSWQSRNHSGLHGYNVVYTDLEGNNSVPIQLLDRNVRALRVNKLEADTKYLVCVLGLGAWIGPKDNESDQISFNAKMKSHQFPDESVGKCTEVKTLEAPEITYGKGFGDKWDSSNSILTRRLGLIVGSCLGSIVFFILISILGYIKIQKQRRVCNRDQTLPPEYLSYRHFSIQSGDGMVHSTDHVIGASITYF